MYRITTFLLLFFLVSCESQKYEANSGRSVFSSANYGIVSGNSVTREVEDMFIEAITLLHNFEYMSAAQTFRQIQELNPEFVLAYWGEAMSLIHPLWDVEDLEGGRTVLARLATTAQARLEKAKNPLEAGLMEAIELLYEEKNHSVRVNEYADFMEALYSKYPDNVEVGSFYALALLGTSGEGRDLRTYMKAAGILESLFIRYPEHHGVLHYLIHSYDDPTHAQLGMRPALRYDELTNDSTIKENTHISHMPSHIYLALGMWDDVIISNIKSLRAGEKQLIEKNASLGQLTAFEAYYTNYYHSVWWLLYGYLQKDDTSTALEMLNEMREESRIATAKLHRRYFMLMRAHYISDAQDSMNEALDVSIELDGFLPIDQAIYHYSNAYLALQRNSLNEAMNHAELLFSIDGDIEGSVKYTSFLTYESVSQDALQNLSRDDINVLTMQVLLTGMIAYKKGDIETGLATIAQSSSMLIEKSFDYGPPTIPKPPSEVYGELLFQEKRYEEALQNFNLSLKRYPGRAASLTGAAESRNYIEYLDSSKNLEVVHVINPESNNPLRFRSTNNLTGISQDKLKGLQELNMAGGGQLTEEQMIKLKKETGGKLRIIDVRQEPHVYLDGLPVTWYKSYITDIKDVKNPQSGINSMKEMENEFVEFLNKNSTIVTSKIHWGSEPVYELIENIQLSPTEILTNEQMAQKHNIEYNRFFIPVFPESFQEKEFIELVDSISDDETVYVQCWDGTGRSTVFMTMFDILKNHEVSLELIVERQASLGGINTSDLYPRESSRYKRSLDRKTYIERFYESIH